MSFFSPEFFSALLAIVVIDLVLAGDNAIVIALAARNLRADLRKRAVLWGTVGAVVVRSAMTLAVVWLLKVPGLMLAGGVLLLWIAYKLLVPKEEDGEHAVAPAANFWGAMKTIVIADAVMGLDNVLAVAGAAHGSFVLVVLGLLISIPIVVWGSSIILKFVDRYPSIIYIGAGVLAWTAAKMIVSEPALKDAIAPYPFVSWIVYVAALGGVLGGGYAVSQERRLARSLERNGQYHSSSLSASADNPLGGLAMNKLLLPVDGSANSVEAARHVVKRYHANRDMEIHVLNVQPAFSRHIGRFVPAGDRARHHRDRSERASSSVRKLLERNGIPFTVHAAVGDRADTIVRWAKDLRVSEIVMGTARKNSLTRLVQSSVTSRVLELASVPVHVITGGRSSPFERYGIPAGLGVAAALLIAAD